MSIKKRKKRPVMQPPNTTRSVRVNGKVENVNLQVPNATADSSGNFIRADKAGVGIRSMGDPRQFAFADPVNRRPWQKT